MEKYNWNTQILLNKKKLIEKYFLNSQEESYGHTKPLGKQEQKRKDFLEKQRLWRLKPNTHIEDRLKHLTIGDKWD